MVVVVDGGGGDGACVDGSWFLCFVGHVDVTDARAGNGGR